MLIVCPDTRCRSTADEHSTITTSTKHKYRCDNRMRPPAKLRGKESVHLEQFFNKTENVPAEVSSSFRGHSLV